jgi:sugar diacid utilization regulator
VLTLAEILRHHDLSGVTVLTGGGLPRQVRAVRVAESLSGVPDLPDSLVQLTSSAAREVGSYRFEVLLRRVSGGGVVGLLIPLADGAVLPRTALALAERGSVSLLRVREDADIAELVLAVGRAISVGAGAAIAALDGFIDQLVALESAGGAQVDEVLRLARSFLPDVELRPDARGQVRAAVLVNGVEEGWLTSATYGGPREVLAKALVQLAAGAVGRIRTDERRAEEAPIRSAAELLTELLAADPTRSPWLLNRARSMGLAVDGWHIVGRIELDGPDPVDESATFAFLETIAALALQTVRASGGTWHVARSESAVLLVRTFDADPGASAVTRVAKSLERAVASVAERFPGHTVRGGVGSAHAGPTGLRATGAEARAAIGAARTTARDDAIAIYDVVGLQRMLLEWYASDTARESVHELLGPLDRLGPKKAATAIRTLQAYLDEQGSIARTARGLFLHRNAVAYRIRRIEELLGADLSDPDQRLALQLACRARTLGVPGSGGPGDRGGPTLAPTLGGSRTARAPRAR